MANADIKQLEITEFNLTAEVIGKEKLIVDMMQRLEVKEDRVPPKYNMKPSSLEHEILSSIQ